MIAEVIFTPLSIVDTVGGNVLHAMKTSEPGYCGFSEAYFSTIHYGVIKGWKRHREMVLNLIVPNGAIRFVIFDVRPGSSTRDQFWEVTLSLDNFGRLTIPPMLWFAFQGMDKKDSLLLNIANISHDPKEVDLKDLDSIKYDWSKSYN